MSDYAPIDPPRARGARTGVIVVLVLLAFVAGIALAGYAMRTVRWLMPAPTDRQPAATAGAPEGFLPAAPLNASGEAAQADPQTLATREAALAGQLASLEARTATVTADAAAAGSQATRAEGLLAAFAARRALDRGLGLGYLEEQLRARFAAAQPRAVGIVIQAGRQPVTLEDLRQGLDAIAPDISTAGSQGWLTSVRRELGTLVVLRRAGTPSPLPADRLSRARRLLDGGQVEAARAEIVRLPGAADATNWIAAADRYVTARHALDLIENAAILGQAGQPGPVRPVQQPSPTRPLVQQPVEAQPPAG